MLPDDDTGPEAAAAPPGSLVTALIMAQGMYPDVRLFEVAVPAD